jgi:hypothetical protein
MHRVVLGVLLVSQQTEFGRKRTFFAGGDLSWRKLSREQTQQ